MRLIAAAVAALLVASAAAAQPVITRPDWEHKPDGDAMTRLYPPGAGSLHVSGRVVVDCGVDAAGTLQDCRVVSEDPGDYGFGDSAIRAARQFKMRPQTLDGLPMAGGRVRIPLNFAASGMSQGRPVGFEGPPAILRPLDAQASSAHAGGGLGPVPCPGERGRQCMPELFAWRQMAGPAQRADLYGSVELTCRISDDGMLERCSGRELMTGARVLPALEAAKHFGVPAATDGGPTAGLWVRFTLRGGRGLQTF